MSGNFDIRGRRVSYPKEYCVATPEELVKTYGGSEKTVIKKVCKCKRAERRIDFYQVQSTLSEVMV